MSPDGGALWQAVFQPETLPASASPDLLRAAPRLASLTSPALAAFLLARAAQRLGVALIDPQRVENSRLDARFTRAAQLKCATLLAEAGIHPVYLKGFANAFTLYPDPDLRLFGDLDILVDGADLDRAIALLAARGFTFRPEAVGPWGFQAEGSFVPFTSADNACDLDLHTEPDSFPINRALTAARVLAAAREIAVGPLTLRVPSLEHTLILCLSNAAKDKLGPLALRKLMDAVRLLAASPKLDWDAIVDLLRRGRSVRPARVIFALLARLGAPLPRLPRILARPPGWPARGEFERLVADYRALFPRVPAPLTVLRRELLLAAAPGVALRLNARRLAGLVRPRSGIPGGWGDAATS